MFTAKALPVSGGQTVKQINAPNVWCAMEESRVRSRQRQEVESMNPWREGGSSPGGEQPMQSSWGRSQSLAEELRGAGVLRPVNWDEVKGVRRQRAMDRGRERLSASLGALARALTSMTSQSVCRPGALALQAGWHASYVWVLENKAPPVLFCTCRHRPAAPARGRRARDAHEGTGLTPRARATVTGGGHHQVALSARAHCLPHSKKSATLRPLCLTPPGQAQRRETGVQRAPILSALCTS